MENPGEDFDNWKMIWRIWRNNFDEDAVEDLEEDFKDMEEDVENLGEDLENVEETF